MLVSSKIPTQKDTVLNIFRFKYASKMIPHPEKAVKGG